MDDSIEYLSRLRDARQKSAELVVCQRVQFRVQVLLRALGDFQLMSVARLEVSTMVLGGVDVVEERVDGVRVVFLEFDGVLLAFLICSLATNLTAADMMALTAKWDPGPQSFLKYSEDWQMMILWQKVLRPL